VFDGHGQDGEKVSGFIKKILGLVIEEESLWAFKPRRDRFGKDEISLA